jgi:CubicO group peptidase (beta-lactamase class C family)
MLNALNRHHSRPRPSLRWALLLATALLAGCPDDAADAADAPRRDPRYDAVVEVVLAELDANPASGVSIAVMEKGVLTWAEGFGSASPIANVPIRPDTTFQIGSTTKQLTAMAVLTQVDQGLYSLDEPVASLLPEFSLKADPAWAAQTTVRDLLSHRSGLTDHINVQRPAADDDLAAYYLGEFARTQYAMSPPGQFWNYSNPNYNLAGLILEAQDPRGRTYPEIITDDLFAPLGMRRSFSRVGDAAAAGNYADSIGAHPRDVRFGRFPDIAFGEPGPRTIAELSDAASERPAGGSTFSTASDMCRWGYFVLHGDRDVISDTTRTAMTTPQAPLLWNDVASYGLGQFVWDEFPLDGNPFATEYYPIRVWEHGGNTLSFTSSLLILPDHDVVISILSNGDSSVHAATQAAILRVALGPLPAPVTYAPTVDQTKLPQLAGTYVDPKVAGDIVITEGGAGGLQIAIPAFSNLGYPVEADLLPISTHVWIATIAGLSGDLTFVVDPNGEVTPWLRSRMFVGRRTPVSTPTDNEMQADVIRAAGTSNGSVR